MTNREQRSTIEQHDNAHCIITHSLQLRKIIKKDIISL